MQVTPDHGRAEAATARRAARHGIRHFRRGSVLIMTVALLVLLAIMGTAWIATSRLDRDASTANNLNTQAEIAISSLPPVVADAVAQSVWARLASTGGESNRSYRPRNSSYEPQRAYTPYDSYQFDRSLTWGAGATGLITTTAMDAGGNMVALVDVNAKALRPHPRVLLRTEFLAARAPIVGPGGRPVWPAISAPLLSANNPVILQEVLAYETADPTAPPMYAGYDNLVWASRMFESPLGNGQPPTYSVRYNIEPTYAVFNEGSPSGPLRSHPAFKLGATVVLAADTDGDGVADAGLWRLPMGQMSGVTWYAAIRIIDTNSAINVNTAYQRFGADSQDNSVKVQGNFFPTNISLADLLVSGGTMTVPQQLQSLNSYRAGLPTVQTWTYDPVGRLESGQAAVLDLTDLTWKAGAASALPYGFQSRYEALWAQLGRRLDYPGFSGTTNRYRAFPETDDMALMRGFIVAPVNPTENGTIGQVIRDTVIGPYDKNGLTGRPYPEVGYYCNPSAAAGSVIDAWYWENFNYFDSNKFSRKAILTTRNGVSNALTQAGSVGTASETKVNINTADFGRLYRAFWNVMADASGGDASPFRIIPFDPPPPPLLKGIEPVYLGQSFDPTDRVTPIAGPAPWAPNAQNHNRMFRSSLRSTIDDWANPSASNPYRFSVTEQMKLRAAIAATNTIQLRQPPGVQIWQNVNLQLANGTPASVRIYGARPQPVIGEVYVDNDSITKLGGVRNTQGYVAVALYNPTPVSIDLTGWRLVAAWRTTDGLVASGVAPVVDFASDPDTDGDGLPDLHVLPPTPCVIPPGKWLILENYYDPSVGLVANPAAKFRPPGLNFNAAQAAGAQVAYVRDLGRVFNVLTPPPPATPINGCELILLRPADPSNYQPYNGPTQPGTPWTEMIPVDCFDFRGLPARPGANARRPAVGDPPVTVDVEAWYYRRECALPGDVGTAQPYACIYPGRFDGTMTARRHQGTIRVPWQVTLNSSDQTSVVNPPAPGFSLPPAASNFATSGRAASYPNTFIIPLPGFDQAGPYAGQTNFPNGGFARVGDIMQVPFIGAYRVTYGNNTVLEMQPITLDSVFAEDTDPNDDYIIQLPGNQKIPVENVGRPVPLLPNSDAADGAPDDAKWHDFSRDPRHWRYRWATKLFQYFTVESPGDQHLPNAPREVNDLGATAVPTTLDPAQANRRGVEGLVNINTAPVGVLAAVPWLTPQRSDGIATDTTITGMTNLQLAQAIVAWRDGYFDGSTFVPGHGPFKTLFDLYRVPQFRSANLAIMLHHEPDDADGDLSPVNSSSPQLDGIRYDYEERYLLLNRISNLITTQSDRYLVYIMVQGWRNIGTPNPELVIQRRLGMIVDRNELTRQNRTPRTLTFPLD